LFDKDMVCRHDGDAAIGEPSSKSPLVRLSTGGTTENVDAKSIEVDALALNDANHHPAECL
jgi:hypothetical protein